VLIRGTLPAYYLGLQLTKSEVGAKWGELLFIFGFLGIYWLLRKRLSVPPLLRHGRLLILGLLLYIGWSAWLHYWGTYGIITMNLPRPWADKGHPNWVSYIDKQVEKAEFRKQEIQFLQALVYQLRGDAEFAKQLYQSLTQDARALNNLGVLASEQNRDTAQTYFQQALQQKPDYAPARYNLAVLAGDTQGISEQAQAYDAWLPTMYQHYAPERLWIANPAMKEWCSTLYWSRGGFWYKSFLEPMVRFTNPAKLFQADLQQLR
jgi:tetratricopeptide (TPR) repeat protein